MYREKRVAVLRDGRLAWLSFCHGLGVVGFEEVAMVRAMPNHPTASHWEEREKRGTWVRQHMCTGLFKDCWNEGSIGYEKYIHCTVAATVAVKIATSPTTVAGEKEEQGRGGWSGSNGRPGVVNKEYGMDTFFMAGK
ncbi:hypothetical protein M406DRAFT_72187 [Cryphonectria parasitica EP155]|uniref:Uncharacterized protein n=1 Tax=Cryphonectria parasitica (strain ATCC 38755 / EP155) TaxID=660469 RepID=A0A9P4XX37_CRYP1|nr:uncharacterized protein M406DRAFT_72187 [Cryphonectria parasitica EP155]KAF3762165.1 hypothetical protein M406DRAFT_72187 [Cryphonectria parasitica EP155]